MTRKLSVLLFLCVLALCLPSVSPAEPAPLTRDEFAAFTERILETAKSDGFCSVSEKGPDGSYLLCFKDFMLYADRPELTDGTVLRSVVLEVPEEDILFPDLRGVCVWTSSVWDVLAAYPLDNPSLSGTREEAGLCLSGSVPGNAFAGRLSRDGQTVTSVRYSLYTAADGGVNVHRVVYDLKDGAVFRITADLAPRLISIRDAQKEYGECADLMTVREYSAYLPSARSSEPFHEEDLLFSGLDFLRLTPSSAAAVLGDPLSETWAADGEQWVCTLSWQGLSVSFVCDGEKNPLHAAGLFLDEDLLEGPRGLMPGAGLDSVLDRFQRTDAPVSDTVTELYRLEDGSRGELEVPAEGLATVRYYCPAGGGSVLLRLYFESGVLKNLALLREQ